MKTVSQVALTLTILVSLAIANDARADIIMGSSSYLSAADIPSGFYAGAPLGLEDFEDNVLSFGIIASVGSVLSSGTIRDSVDADDGTIDGSGSNGNSWFALNGNAGVTFTFAGPLPTAAGIVWTDGLGTTRFEAFGPGMVSLGFLTANIADGSVSGTTADDRFFGARDAGGILAIKLSNSFGGIEMDHVQFGMAGVPEPTSGLLVAASIGLLALYRIRRK